MNLYWNKEGGWTTVCGMGRHLVWLNSFYIWRHFESELKPAIFNITRLNFCSTSLLFSQKTCFFPLCKNCLPWLCFVFCFQSNAFSSKMLLMASGAITEVSQDAFDEMVLADGLILPNQRKWSLHLSNQNFSQLVMSYAQFICPAWQMKHTKQKQQDKRIQTFAYYLYRVQNQSQGFWGSP